MQTVGRQILDDKELQLSQFLIGSAMMLRKSLHIIIITRTTVEQTLDIREEGLLLILHVTAYLMGILIIELQDQLRQGIVGIERLGELTTDIGQLEVEEIGMAGLEIV